MCVLLPGFGIAVVFSWFWFEEAPREGRFFWCFLVLGCETYDAGAPRQLPYMELKFRERIGVLDVDVKESSLGFGRLH